MLREGKVAHLVVAVCVTFALLLAGPSWGQQNARLVLEPTARAIAQANRCDASQMYNASMATAFAGLLYSYRGFADELSRKEVGGAPASPASRPSTISAEDAAREVERYRSRATIRATTSSPPSARPGTSYSFQVSSARGRMQDLRSM